MKAEKSGCRPREILTTVGRAYPQAWAAADRARAARNVSGATWPDWCFLPLEHAYAIVSSGGTTKLGIDRIHHVGVVGALAAWRVSQGIYRFDPTLYENLAATPVDGDLPCELLYRMPEWCVYVETIGLTWEGRSLHGFWAHMEFAPGRPDQLRLLLDTAADTSQPLDTARGLVPIPIILGNGGLQAALDRVIRTGAHHATAAGLLPLGDPSLASPFAQIVEPFLSLLLYLCSQGADIAADGRRPVRPVAKKTKSGFRLFPPESPTTWDVGVRIGAALRRGFEALAVADGDGTGHAGPRPHIRRAHWHGFWTGSTKVPSERKLDVRWLPPIPVRVDDLDALPATVRPVRPEE
ncbi:MAG: hypothetical protein KF778_21395 [Rhodocyclaceae bacterium]|nr:hypothetical protein [Rhodocyclaceae bacterium]